MGRRCCIANCSSTSRLQEHHGVTYHSFPLDPQIRAIWMRNTRLSADRTITKSVLVCSRHFRRVDFQPQRSGKYLLKQRVFPTVFPWGKVEPAQIEADVESLKNVAANASPNTTAAAAATAATTTATTNEDETKATVEATVAQIMAETAELSAKTVEENVDKPALGAAASGVRFERVTNFHSGVRLEAQDFDGLWHTARVVEVDNDDCEVLIKFEKTGKIKSAVVGTEEWIPMNSTRLRQKVSSKPIPVFELEEKCMARWTGPRKFPGTVKKILGNDVYEVLFDDGYIKNVRAIHMNKILNAEVHSNAAVTAATSIIPATSTSTPSPTTVHTNINKFTPRQNSFTKRRITIPGRNDWPLLDMSKLDLASLNLPEIPHDGEWTCHWVNDQPIGREGFLVVGEHRKPTVIVDDWRLPPCWVKHMYQRSNVLGKWDVILVTPTNKRFRSKADLKVYLEEQGEVYNPDIYDFSIHRRRAKDINAYVYTPDYKPAQSNKPKSLPAAASLDTTLDKSLLEPTSELIAEKTKAALESSLACNSSFLETPVASYLPPMELMTSPVKMDSMDEDDINSSSAGVLSKTIDKFETDPVLQEAYDGSFAFIGGLKVSIVDNLFRCPQNGCTKHFRKENHLQIHVKHYHRNLFKLLGACPKMQELAEKRTIAPDTQAHEPQPKNQIPNQEFFAKLHQQDLEQSRAHRRKPDTEQDVKIKLEVNKVPEEAVKLETKIDFEAENDTKENINKINSELDESAVSLNNADKSTVLLGDEKIEDLLPPTKRMRTISKRSQGSRKSNRQRTTRHYYAGNISQAPRAVVTTDKNATDFEDTRHDFNITPTVEGSKKRKTLSMCSAVDSPVTADSGSGSLSAFPTAQTGLEADSTAAELQYDKTAQYIGENGEIIKIVRMRQEEIINCLCQYGEEDGLMIQCELCLCWQHGACNGIERESDVPDKYVCYICRNPTKARENMRYKHDQDWLYEGKLPVANFHVPNPALPKRFELLKKSHVLAGNLIDLQRVMHSLSIKINICNNRCHPKLYLWAKNWDDHDKINSYDVENDGTHFKTEAADEDNNNAVEPMQTDDMQTVAQAPIIPQPEAPIDPEECQKRLIEHIKVQHNIVTKRLNEISLEIDDLEAHDDLYDLKDADMKTVKETVAYMIRELEILKQLTQLEPANKTPALNMQT